MVSEDPNLERSKTRQDGFNQSVNELSQRYIRETFLPEVRRLTAGICSAEVEEGSPDVINIRYPSIFTDRYLRPEIRLEIGPLAQWIPNARYEVRPYAAEVFPDLFAEPVCYVQAIKAERTFWEKVTILHCEAFRPETKPLPSRYWNPAFSSSRNEPLFSKGWKCDTGGILQCFDSFIDPVAQSVLDHVP